MILAARIEWLAGAGIVKPITIAFISAISHESDICRIGRRASIALSYDSLFTIVTFCLSSVPITRVIYSACRI
ncbi:hypothetical protein BJV82DRAFT_610343 [Fennellomyces sp. T-0311]|nr:hypothetical protein BJV82DRAFT_610343 [Fennellomyces sp. T-0311]